METQTVIASYYRTTGGDGPALLELVDLGTGQYIVTVNGAVQDARHKLTRDEARQWYDTASRQLAARP